MKEELDKLSKSIDKLSDSMTKMDDRLDNVDKTLIAQHESLKYHILRTDLAEERLTKVEDENKIAIKDIKHELEPVKQHVHRVEGALKLIGAIAAITTIIATIYKLII